MKKRLLVFFIFCLLTLSSFGQTTAMNFTQNDCNGNPQDLFSDLDAGQAVVLFYYMPNCSTCPPPALNSTTCQYTASWVSSNNLSLYTPMGGTGANEVAYYGGFGMPTVVLVGGANHDVLWSTQNWVTSDTTTMRDLILNMACIASTEELQVDKSNLKVYPNPAANELTIALNVTNTESVFVELQDVTGRTILDLMELKSENGFVQQSLDVTGVPNGNYFLKVNVNGNVITNKVVIQ